MSNNGLLPWLNDALKQVWWLQGLYGHRSYISELARGSQSCGNESRAVKEGGNCLESRRLPAAGVLLPSLSAAVGSSAHPALLSHHVCPVHIGWRSRKSDQVASQCGLRRSVPELSAPRRAALLELVIRPLLSPKTAHSEPCMCQPRRHRRPASSGEMSRFCGPAQMKDKIKVTRFRSVHFLG